MPLYFFGRFFSFLFRIGRNELCRVVEAKIDINIDVDEDSNDQALSPRSAAAVDGLTPRRLSKAHARVLRQFFDALGAVFRKYDMLHLTLEQERQSLMERRRKDAELRPQLPCGDNETDRARSE